MSMLQKLKKLGISAMVLAAGFAYYLAARFFFAIPCMFRTLTGFKCPGCGITHMLVAELAVCDGDARVDVAVANDKLCGYEIKSDADTLKRLALQQKCYDKTFDAISIVVGEKFKDDIEKYIPDYWGVYVVCKDDSGCKIKMRRAAKENKNVEAESLLELLWKEELIKFLKDAGVKGISGKNRRLLRQMAIDNFTLKEIKNYTREVLKGRQDWRD